MPWTCYECKGMFDTVDPYEQPPEECPYCGYAPNA